MTTLFHDTMQALEQSLHCSLIASELDFKEGVFPLGAPDDAILDYAIDRSFSRIGLFGQEESPDAVTHLAVVDLNAKCIKSRDHLTVDDVIAGETPVAQAIDLLSSRPFYFVLEGHQVRRIVTVSDLNRLPVRTYLHTLLDHLEGLLADWIEAVHPENTWLDLLPDVQEDIKMRHTEMAVQDFDIRMVDCTSLTQKTRILRKTEDSLDDFQYASKRSYDRDANAIRRLRNRIAHGIPPLDKNADELRNHVRHNGQLTKRADVEWLSRTVGVLRDWIEVLAGEEVSG